jgi:hypothetical protein
MSKVVSLRRQISVEEVWRRILPKCDTKSEAHNPRWMAIVYINTLIQLGILKLFVDGKPVHISFLHNLFVTSVRWGDDYMGPCIRTRIALEKRLDEYVWSFSEAEVKRVVANFAEIRVKHLVGRYGL